ncbi:MAG: protein-L-isoaspartate(D-aspartate) O-methyltransferase [Acidobacteriota bacterium]|nr:MAG: protein-L-isoaspartate(D-aspartate) O-methyltransferase [Acidobacteriota bacterium]
MFSAFKVEREKMVRSQIEARGISDPRVLSAFSNVPRHHFVPEQSRSDAYRDCPLSIGYGQTISQPYMVASMTLAARIHPGDKVLEIGTGSGYQAAILAYLGASVFTVERQPDLSRSARETLSSLGYDAIQFKVGDGTLGWPEESPFDAIIVTAGAPALPEPLRHQLKEGGRLVVPIEEGYCQILSIFTRIGDELKCSRGDRCTFVPLIGAFGWDR